MGTVCVVRFRRGACVAPVSVSMDRNEVRDLLAPFFEDVEAQCPYPGDSRYFDPEYLAAKFIVWCATRFRVDDAHPLHFAGVGVASGTEGDAAIDVVCLKGPLSTGRPRVKTVPLTKRSKGGAS